MVPDSSRPPIRVRSTSTRTSEVALSNRDRIDRMFQVMAPAMDDFIASVIGAIVLLILYRVLFARRRRLH